MGFNESTINGAPDFEAEFRLAPLPTTPAFCSFPASSRLHTKTLIAGGPGIGAQFSFSHFAN